ncbi:MAG: hypothetical protein QOG80_929 [Pseudonocardiales bacterium]|nr:hypothetical protein [Pseudonocardiales bacterium]
MRQLPDSPVFNRTEILAAGWTDAALQRAIRAGRVNRLRRGFFARPDVVDPVIAAKAAVRACSGSVISHRSAALLHGLPLVGYPPDTPELTVQPRVTGDINPGHLYRAKLRPVDVTEIDGVPVTSISRTLVDLARAIWLVGSVAAVDYALHEGLVSREQLSDAALACRGWPRSRRIPWVLDTADGRAESPLETVSRLVLHHLGVPRPDLQPTIRTLDGKFIGRADFYWDRFGVVGEADGRGKYTERDVLVAEKLRQERLEDAGLVVVRWTWADATFESQRLKRRIERAFERGRARDAMASPRGWSVVAAPTGD